jgi:hypothetical protein
MSTCAFCGSLERDFSTENFCGVCRSKWREDTQLDEPDQVAQYCANLYEIFESSKDDPNSDEIKKMRERYKISLPVHSHLVQELTAKLKVVEGLSEFTLEFDENINDAFAKEDTFLRFKFTNRSKSVRFKSALLKWDDPETNDDMDYEARSQSPIKPTGYCELTSTHVFQRSGRKQISKMYLTVENFSGESANFLVNTIYFSVKNLDQKVINNISSHTQINMNEMGILNNENNQASPKIELNDDITPAKWREVKTHIKLDPPKEFSGILGNYRQEKTLTNPINQPIDEAQEFTQTEILHGVVDINYDTTQPQGKSPLKSNLVAKVGLMSNSEPLNVRDASEAVFKCFHLLNSITPFADPNAVVYSSNFSLDFLDLVFSVVPDEAEDQVIGMIFENGSSVINNHQDDVIEFAGNALVFAASGITVVTCIERNFEVQVDYSWAEVGKNNWTFYRRKFGENSYLISFGDGVAGQSFLGCKFDLRKYRGDLSLNDVFTSAENALAKVIELAPSLPEQEVIQEEAPEEETEEFEEFEEFEEDELELAPEPEPVIDNSALIELDSRLQRFFSLFSFALQFCKEGQPKPVFIENEISPELMDHLYEVIQESGTGLSAICLDPKNAQLSFDGKLVGWTGPATGLSPEGIFHLTKDTNGAYALDGSTCFLSWTKFFKDYKGNLFMREQGPDIWFGTQSNYMIQACYADYSAGVLQWDYFEEFIQNDLVESFQLFKEATEWEV